MVSVKKACLIIGTLDFVKQTQETLTGLGILTLRCDYKNFSFKLSKSLVVQGIIIQLPNCEHGNIKHIIEFCSNFPEAKIIVVYKVINRESEMMLRTQHVVFLGHQELYFQHSASIIMKAFKLDR